MTPREPSEAALKAAIDAFTRATRYATGNKRTPEPCPYSMEKALRAAYAVDAKEEKP